MLILGAHGLVVLETPKTGSLALRAMLAPYALPIANKAPRHLGHDGYLRKHAARLTDMFGQPPQTVAVLRDPVERMESWYRYRRRPQLRGRPASTHKISFENFILAYLDESTPEMASVGRQDRFVGWDGQVAQVDHLFDYAQLPLLEAFFSHRIGVELALPRKNETPPGIKTDNQLTPKTLARFQTQNIDEITLYHEVALAGHLTRPGLA